MSVVGAPLRDVSKHTRDGGGFGLLHDAIVRIIDATVRDEERKDMMRAMNDGHLATTLVKAAEHGAAKDVRRLLEMGAPINHLRSKALRRAIHLNHVDVVSVLIADPRFVINAWGGEALTIAARLGRVEIIQLLLNANPPADIHVMDDAALYNAARFGHAEAVRVLLAAGPPADGGTRALGVAVRNQHHEVADIINQSRSITFR